MKRYYKKEADSKLGKGIIYLEFEDNWATRQVETYEGKWFNSTQTYHNELGPPLVDQPFFELDLNSENEISQEEFEVAWEKSKELD